MDDLSVISRQKQEDKGIDLEIFDLQEWMNNNQPKETMIYKDGFYNQILFIRDNISYIFSKTVEEYRSIKKEVISTHTSKSIKLPVMRLTIPHLDTIFIMRYNFHDWKISVNSSKDININFYDLFDQDKVPSSCYFEGFDKKWIYGPYSKSHKKFSVELKPGLNEVYVFFWLCSKALLNE